MYWHTEPEGMFPAFNFGRVMSIHKFEEFLNVWQLSEAEDMDQQVLDFIEAVNENLKKAMRAGEVLCLDESMIKAFHRGLNGKMKIIRKLRPVGNELKRSVMLTHILFCTWSYMSRKRRWPIKIMSKSLVQQLLAPYVLLITGKVSISCYQ